MTREEMAAVLEEIALLLELKDENPFKVRAYRHGAEAVLSHDGDIVQLAANNQLEGIKGIGDALRIGAAPAAETDRVIAALDEVFA